MIITKNNKYYLYSKDGSKKLGGPYNTREQALKREHQVEYFKHLNKEGMFKTAISPKELEQVVKNIRNVKNVFVPTRRTILNLTTPLSYNPLTNKILHSKGLLRRFNY